MRPVLAIPFHEAVPPVSLFGTELPHHAQYLADRCRPPTVNGAGLQEGRVYADPVLEEPVFAALRAALRGR